MPKYLSFSGLTLVWAFTSSIAAIPVDVTFGADAYFSATCSGDVLNLGLDNELRWEAAQADGAWLAAVRQWNEVERPKEETKSLTFINTMMNIWGQSEQNCGLVADSCDFSALQCGDQTMPGGQGSHVPTPGAWMIMKSLGHLHSFYLNLYNSLHTASADLSNSMAVYVETFAPQKEVSLLEQILEGFVQASFRFALGYLFGTVTEGLEVIGKFVDTASESVNDLIEKGIESQTIPQTTDQQRADTLVTTLQAVMGVHQLAVQKYIGDLTSGSANTQAAFHDTIGNGKWIDSGPPADLYNLNTAIKQAFSALLLPIAWRLTTFPIILMENTPCDPGNPLTEMTDDATHSGGSCLVEGKTFYLVGYEKNKTCETTGPYHNYLPTISACKTEVFKKLPGFDQLTDYGLGKDDIIASVYDAYVLNGNKNGYKLDPATRVVDGAGNQGAYPFSAGTRTPGLYSIPICEMGEAINNYKKLNFILCDYSTGDN